MVLVPCAAPLPSDKLRPELKEQNVLYWFPSLHISPPKRGFVCGIIYLQTVLTDFPAIIQTVIVHYNIKVVSTEKIKIKNVKVDW